MGARTFIKQPVIKWLLLALFIAPGFMVGLLRLAQRDYYAYSLLLGERTHWAENIVYQMEGEEEWSVNHPLKTGLMRLRADIRFPEDGYQNPALSVTLIGSYDLYWDGELLAGNGLVGQSGEEEEPGAFIRIFNLPPERAGPGLHRIMVRLSNFHQHDPELQPVILLGGDAVDLVRGPLRLTAFIYALAGLFLLGGGYFLIIYLVGERDAGFLVFSMMGLVLFLLAVMEFIKYCFDFPYTFHYIRLQIIYVLTALTAILLSLFCAFHFRLKYKIHLAVGLVFCAFAVKFWESNYDQAALLIMAVGLLSALCLAGWGWYSGAPDGPEIFTGVASCSILAVSYDLTLFLGFAILMAAMILAMARTRRRQRLEHENARLRSVRLEAELLKKQLQPHFLMNTLASLVAWVEDQPAQGVLFIEALAEELALLNRISKQRLIPFQQEVALCRAHLTVMEFRNEVKYGLSVEGGEKQLIPPAVFHTLVENGLTHLQPVRGSILFHLSACETADHYVYVLKVGGLKGKKVERPEGSGLRYVKARLEECWPGEWWLNHGPDPHGWITEIGVAKQGKGGDA